ncbi:hypothetical protein OE810_09240 [Rhodobacteraceae bacterium XHP0102]|nr:hypothetical protein [Rhodobacteraceae bacterium XHP0102]
MKQPSHPRKTGTDAPRSAQEARTARLKAALKANLARRKAQARKRRAEDGEEKSGH